MALYVELDMTSASDTAELLQQRLDSSVQRFYKSKVWKVIIWGNMVDEEGGGFGVTNLVSSHHQARIYLWSYLVIVLFCGWSKAKHTRVLW